MGEQLLALIPILQMHFWVEFLLKSWKPAFEILLLAIAIYYVFSFVRGTRGFSILTGFLGVVLVLGVITSVLDLKVLRWLLGYFSAIFAVATLVIFQPEL